jgi:hypothetical protein
MRDHIVDEVRKAREDYARQFNFDLDAIGADLQRKQALSKTPVVTSPKRPPTTIGKPIPDKSASKSPHLP